VVTTTIAEQVDAAGTVQVTSVAPQPGDNADMTVTILNRDTALRTVAGTAGGVDTYRMFITLPAPDKRYVANFGIVSKAGDEHGAPGDLRGFSLFRGTRFAPAEFTRRRAELRQRNAVHAVVEAGPDGKAIATRLD
jgi:hypothetical protein